MQPLVTSSRLGETNANVKYQIQDSPALVISAGAELLDQSLNVIVDFTDDLLDGSVKRSNYATLHGTAELTIARELPWGSAIVRPYMILNGLRFNLGAYYTNTPDRAVGSEPLTYAVQCYDLLDALNTPVGEAYSLGQGANYLASIENILRSLGFTQLQIDKSRAATNLPNARAWPLDATTTWLGIVNDLLAAIGYRGIWSDWDGYLRCEPYLTPDERAVEWVYDSTDPTVSMVSVQRTLSRDYYNAPNKWVAIRNNNVASTTPVEGDGVYTYVNQYNGLTSIEGRGGRVVTSILPVDAADQDALIAQTMRSVESDLRLQAKITLQSAPNPLHWHFDKLTFRDDEVGVDVAVMESEWTLPLLGGWMGHVWTVLS